MKKIQKIIYIILLINLMVLPVHAIKTQAFVPEPGKFPVLDELVQEIAKYCPAEMLSVNRQARDNMREMATDQQLMIRLKLQAKEQVKKAAFPDTLSHFLNGFIDNFLSCYNMDSFQKLFEPENLKLLKKTNFAEVIFQGINNSKNSANAAAINVNDDANIMNQKKIFAIFANANHLFFEKENGFIENYSISNKLHVLTTKQILALRKPLTYIFRSNYRDSVETIMSGIEKLATIPANRLRELNKNTVYLFGGPYEAKCYYRFLEAVQDVPVAKLAALNQFASFFKKILPEDDFEKPWIEPLNYQEDPKIEFGVRFINLMKKLTVPEIEDFSKQVDTNSSTFFSESVKFDHRNIYKLLSFGVDNLAKAAEYLTSDEIQAALKDIKQDSPGRYVLLFMDLPVERAKVVFERPALWNSFGGRNLAADVYMKFSLEQLKAFPVKLSPKFVLTQDYLEFLAGVDAKKIPAVLEYMENYKGYDSARVTGSKIFLSENFK
jgi:hypothetical protein